MSGEQLRLTAYLGERDRVGGAFLADALTDVYARHELRASLLLRGMAGFGARHRHRTDRLLSLSEDLPLVSLAVDARERIEAAAADIAAIGLPALVTLGPVRMACGADPGGGPAKLMIHLGRGQRIAGRPAHEASLDVLRRRGVAGATVLLGVDGTVHGVRERASFIARNTAVPLLVVAVGDSERLGGAAAELEPLLDRPVMTLEDVVVCKRDGELLAAPGSAAPGAWRRLVIYAGEQSRHEGRPQHAELLRALRAAGAAGATTLRGVRGFHGDHEPHGDRFLQLRRRVPVVTTVIDTAERTREWFAIADRMTRETGLVTCEDVPMVLARPSDGA